MERWPKLRPFQISSFREHQRYGSTIADRVWNAWWKYAGLPFSAVERHMIEMADDRPLPRALVAHNGSGYLGTTFLIHSDMDERPQYSPWVAAVWVEASERKRGVGRASVAEAAKTSRALGYRTTFICCRRELEGFYLGLGWRIVEQAAGPECLSVLKLDLVEGRLTIAPGARMPRGLLIDGR